MLDSSHPKYIYNQQVILIPLYLQLRDTTDFKWTPELQQTFDRVKNGTSASRFQIQKNPIIFFVTLLIMVLELNFYKKNQFVKMELVLANSRLFSTTELRLSTILRECSANTYALSEYEFFIQGYKDSTILYTDHKPILLLFTQKKTKPLSL